MIVGARRSKPSLSDFGGASLESLFGNSLTTGSAIFLFLALALALAFEFVNGFHDTANAVATVIYTNSLKPTVAVVWSGIWNLIGVLTSSGAVAFGVIALLPVELVLNVGSGAGFAMVFALLLSAIIWNLGTWYLGLPASSSHTLIGAILGVGLANSWLTPGHVFGEGVNWAKAEEIGISLLASPLIGFTLAALLLIACKALVKRPELYTAPEKGQPPPLWIRSILVLTCTGVSFAHGSNDGQKGMGLVMLILIGLVPAVYAVNLALPPDEIRQFESSTLATTAVLDKYVTTAPVRHDYAQVELSNYLKTTGKVSPDTYSALANKNREITEALAGRSSVKELTEDQRTNLRSNLYLVAESIGKLNKAHLLKDDDKAGLLSYKSHIEKFTKFIPDWVKFAVACALGLGTMIGWKRIVVTVGEKIGKEHLTYAQGASAELVAMTTIGAADILGLPVSTTHVLSSGIAGTMFANRSGLQMSTVRSL
ncbi:MAG: inorganic phosphate transporter, partial [Bryobacteraceae bacterium]|nr:inorganic phosphate transporter [Bryobacteraceae bacterium]